MRRGENSFARPIAGDVKWDRTRLQREGRKLHLAPEKPRLLLGLFYLASATIRNLRTVGCATISLRYLPGMLRGGCATDARNARAIGG